MRLPIVPVGFICLTATRATVRGVIEGVTENGKIVYKREKIKVGVKR